MDKRGNVAIVVLSLLLVISVSTAGYFYWQSQKKEAIQEQPDNEVQQPQRNFPQSSQSEIFFSSLPKAVEALSLKDLPSYSALSQPAIDEDSIWFTGGNNLIQYSVDQKKILRYSNPSLGNCGGNPVVVKNFLYVSCRVGGEQGQQIIYKINLNDLSIAYKFDKVATSPDTHIFFLATDGDNVWVATFNGLGRINVKTNSVQFYTTELGTQATSFGISHIFIDRNYVWINVNAHAYSKGGLSLYDKSKNTWKSFGPETFLDHNKERFDLSTIAKTNHGIKVSYQEYISQDQKYICTVKQYDYSSSLWTTIKQDCEGEKSDPHNTVASGSEEFKIIPDENGLKQFVQELPDGSQRNFQIDARSNLYLSAAFNGKRYLLTGATVDVIDNSKNFPRIAIKLGEDVSVGDDNVSSTEIVSFLIEPNGKYGLVVDSGCDPFGEYPSCGSPTIWLIDLPTEKLIMKYTTSNSTLPKAENLVGELSLASAEKNLSVMGKSGKPLFKINTTTLELSVF